MIRKYEPTKDLKAAKRIWQECGWIKYDDKYLEIFLKDQTVLVAEMDGDAEGLGVTTPGAIKYLQEDIEIGVITAITISHIGRKQGFAGNLVAKLLQQDANSGKGISALGIFDQGFYNKHGYGNGSYEHWFTFDASRLKVPVSTRPPKRLTTDMWNETHNNRLSRMRQHGGVNLYPAGITQAELGWASNPYGFGYFDGPGGKLSHHIWLHAKSVESGPYNYGWMAYENWEQFIELLGFLKSLGDQVYSFTLREPANFQFQDLLDKPFRNRQLTEKSKHEQRVKATSYWQMRILNLEKCLAATHIPGETVEFNLTLTDPIEKYLSGGKWRGVGGEYTVSLGPESSAVKGMKAGLPELKASVNCFTRLWYGIAPASTLAITDDLCGSSDLITRLDRKLRLPKPSPDWDF